MQNPGSSVLLRGSVSVLYSSSVLLTRSEVAVMQRAELNTSDYQDQGPPIYTTHSTIHPSSELSFAKKARHPSCHSGGGLSSTSVADAID